MSVGEAAACYLLSLAASQTGAGCGPRTARRHPAHRPGVSQLRTPRITAELRRRGWVINPKKVYRILREDNLLCLRRRKFVLTTDLGSLLGGLSQPSPRDGPQRPGQLWVVDITYIRLAWEFVYLAVILDAYSRRVVGWALQDTLGGS